MPTSSTPQRLFLLLLTCVTLAFAGVLWPFIGAVFWAIVFAILFQPLSRALNRRLPRSPNFAALATLLICLVVVILPLVVISVSVIQEAVSVYTRMASGQLDFGAYMLQIHGALPTWAHEWMERLQLDSLLKIQERLSSLLAEAGKVVAGKAVEVGSNTLSFVVSLGIMLYLLFFLLRDGTQLVALVRDAIPLATQHKHALAGKFATVIRATVKGNVLVAVVQGALGGLIFWMLGIQGAVLWGVLMAFLSLLPAVGAGLIWGPVAIYFLATGEVTKGLVLTAYGVLVIGLVDNILRPILVGKDTKLPDYLVLISTLGGMSIFGLTGFVIGPAIAALFIACWDIYRDEASDATQAADARVQANAQTQAATQAATPTHPTMPPDSQS